MQNLLLLRTSSMGDLIHTFPALSDLARARPDVAVSWLAEEAFVDIPGLHPQVTRTIPIAWRRWRKHLLQRATWCEMASLRHALGSTRWDLVLDAQGLLKSALPGKLANGPLAGYDAASIREPLASRFYDRRYRVERQLSAIERNRQLFAAAFGYQPSGAPVFGIRGGARADWLPATPYWVLLHATSRDSKLWPEAHWVALAHALQAQGLATVIPWGNATEQQRAQRLAAAIPGALVAPKMRLSAAAAMLGHAAAVVGVDTGLTHLANALDVPLVAIYTDTDPALTGVVATARAANIGQAGVIPPVDAVLALLARCRSTA
ncbi:lipopolysaccharide heptosyltransferase I [Vogesella sp. GCM10023246]|uniref:Lipopolysaccharide heptosyltransferase 1 n=1 Tax=Vogesella oryzagri TaxID=3160864 RepID=A0ABV1M2Y4_9NEIS